MIEEHGRKYAMTIIGIACTVGLTLVGFALAVIEPSISPTVASVLPIVIAAIAGMVATFITGNSAVSFAYAKAETNQSVATRTDVPEGRERVPKDAELEH